MDALEDVAARLREGLELSNQARERALRECREVIRLSSRAIRAVHRLEFDASQRLLLETRRLVDSVRAGLVEHPELYWAGYVHDSQKEYVEAETVYAIAQGLPVPLPEDLGVEAAAYLNGLAEAGSECRRYVLDRLRTGEGDCADRVMQAMDDIYYELVTFDFPDAITGGLRRTTDAFRAVLERTRGDLTLTTQQRSLEEALRAAQRQEPPPSASPDPA